MIKTHRMSWRDCLSHQIMPAIEKGWKDEGKEVHFFWGLGGDNTKQIKELNEKNIDWFMVDVGYLSEPITRYPIPKINDYDKTYFRIVKGNLHTIRCRVGDGRRLSELRHKGIDAEFKGWYTGECKHILLCPSSPTVTFHINGMSVEDWTKEVTEEIKKHTDMPIKFRNKPRPNNEWWNTDIKDDLIDAHCLVTNLSLSAIDAVLNKVPVITHQANVASFISGKIHKINKPMKPGRKTIEEWLNMLCENQFTLGEIENGTAYKVLQNQLI